jgi:hypothetical protein
LTAGAAVYRYITALAVTMGAFAIYVALIAPWIEGTPAEGASGMPESLTTVPLESLKQKLAGLVPPDGWEWGDCSVLESPQAMLLFQTWQVADDGSVLLEPLTMLLRSPRSMQSEPGVGENADDTLPPIVLRSPSGARLKFDKALSLSGDLGRLENGMLPGEVQIFRPSTGEGRNDALSLVTENVQISSERIMSLYDCRFRFGESYGKGKRITIDLPAPTPAVSVKKNVTGIERIELGSVDELFLYRGSAEDVSPLPSAGNDLLGAADRSLWIRCDGPLNWDFNDNVATFDDNVIIETEGQENQLRCQKLTVHFELQADLPAESPQTKRHETPVIKTLHATGSTGSPVVLWSKPLDGLMTAEDVHFDIAARTVRLLSSSLATLTREGQTIESPDIRYTFTDDNRIGTANIRGPGVLRQIADKSGKAMECRWQDLLAIQDDDSGRKVISLDQASVLLDGMQLNSEELHLWMWQIPDSPENGNSRFEWYPSKLLATGQVTMKSTALEGRCAEAAAFWPDPSRTTAGYRRQEPAPVIPQPQAQENLPAPQNGFPRGGMSDPDVPRSTGLPDTVLPPSEADEKGRTLFVGRQLQLKMLDGRDPGVVDELTVDGEVVVQQQQQDESGGFATVLEIRGEQLRGLTQAGQFNRIHVGGSPTRPATVRARDLALTGKEIRLDQGANRLWIDGEGEMQMTPGTGRGTIPAVSNAAFPSNDEDDLQLANSEGVITVLWKGGMIFDGSRLYFESAVQSHSRQTEKTHGESITTTTTSAALSIVLSEPVHFQSARESRQSSQPSVEKLVMVGSLESQQSAFPGSWQDNPSRQVWVALGRYDPTGKLYANQELYAPRVTFDVVSGDAECRGNGTVILRQIAGSGTSDSPVSSLPDAGKRSGPIDFVRIDFTDQCAGNMQQRKMDFTGDVHVLYTDAAEWGEVPADSVTEQEGRRSMVLDCDNLQIAQWTPVGSKPVVDLTASGNARVRGNQFDAVAERISYFEKNGLVTVEAPSRGEAELWFRKPGESRQAHLVARKIVYNIVTGTYEVDQMKKMDYSEGN